VRTHPAVPGWTLGVWIAVLIGAPQSVDAAHRAQAPPDTSLRVSQAPADWDRYHLSRAATEWSLGHIQSAVDHLEAIDLSAGGRFVGADRAAFLLGQAYLRLGSLERFTRLARTVGEWERRSVYTQWLAHQLLLVETEAGAPAAGLADSSGSFAAGDTVNTLRDSTESAVVDSGGVPAAPAGMGREDLRRTGTAAADALAAGVVLQEGDPAAALRLIAAVEATHGASPITLSLKARAIAATGGDDEPALVALSEADTTTTLGRDLAGAAIVQLATRALASGGDPRELLARVPPGSRYASRARHMLGLAAVEHGDVEGGTRILASLLTEDSTYAARREIQLVFAGQALEAGRWDAANEAYQRIDRDLAQQRDTLQRLLSGAERDRLWASWQAEVPLSDALPLDALPTQLLAAQLADSSTDLNARPTLEPPALTAPPASGSAWQVPPPPPEAWRVVASSSRALGEARHEGERTRWAIARERERLADQRSYLGIGVGRAQEERALLEDRSRMLDSLSRSLEALDAGLRAVRDSATARILARAAVILEDCAKNDLWMAGMRHFYLEGPHRERPTVTPIEMPSPDRMLIEEKSLSRAIRELMEGIVADVPGIIARSYEQAWRPGIIDRGPRLALDANRSLAWARALETTIDSTQLALDSSDTLRTLVARAAMFDRMTDSLRTADDALRAEVAKAAIDRALASLEDEREGIDYGLAASAYALSVQLARFDSSGAGSAIVRAGSDATASVVAHDSTGVAAGSDDAAEDPSLAAGRATAREALTTFLARHPDSFARGEMRFRLADLLLLDARQTYREQMAVFVRAQGEGEGNAVPLPVLSQAGALELYRTILREDRDFEHLDAVLFNAGMLLADEGSPDAEGYFSELVNTHADSRYAQESYLRMGDMHFNEGRFGDCVALYEHAAAGGDLGLKAIALYKLGWAHFNEERFLAAADAFRSVMDVYESGGQGAIQVDIEDEAEAYLILTLARAGGGQAFADYFDHLGPRPYERRVLMAMGQHFRRFSLFAEAAATDELFITRYPLEPEALVSAQRLAETYDRWDRGALARQARLDYAPRFAPGSAWYDAQKSDSLRASGEEFARSSLKTVAVYHHLEARKGGANAGAEWREALRLYQELLTRWPGSPETSTYHLAAGEASAKLGDHALALSHYDAAAGSGTDSLAGQALHQRVAVTDAWYESTRAPARGAAVSLGSDSLAREVLAAGDRLLERFPEHAAAADVRWRQGNLAFAHGWLERAAQDFDRMATRHPDDARTPLATSLRADALFRLGDFAGAGAAFEVAQVTAQRAGRDSLARHAAQAIPICYYRNAEAAVAADSTAYEKHAELFEKVATGWPQYEHADLAQYRAGLAYVKAGKHREGVRAMQALIVHFPKSEFVREAHLQTARSWEAVGEREQAAQAYIEFAERYPDEESAQGAWLKAADLWAAAGQEQKAEELRLAYIKRYPADFETALEILEALARKDLVRVTPEFPVSGLFAKTAVKPGKSGNGRSASASPPPPPSSHLEAYLKLAAAHPTLAARDVKAQVQFLRGEELAAGYNAARLYQPLAKSIPAKQKLLDSVLVCYRKSVDLGVPEWAHASAFRIGQALVSFGEALEKSERPADLSGDDLRAYEDVLLEQSRTFHERGEAVWTDLLRKKDPDGPEDKWIAQAQAILWEGLGSRFFFRPETEYPLVGGTPQKRVPADTVKSDRVKVSSLDSSSGARPVAQGRRNER
jgi:tetratricopeptide (TPR) repeat protein